MKFTGPVIGGQRRGEILTAQDIVARYYYHDQVFSIASHYTSDPDTMRLEVHVKEIYFHELEISGDTAYGFWLPYRPQHLPLHFNSLIAELVTHYNPKKDPND